MREPLLEDIIRTTVGKWENKDYDVCESLENLMQSEGWENLQGLWKTLDKVIRDRIKKETDDGVERNIYRLIGIMEGYDLVTSIHERVFIEKEEQQKVRSRLDKTAFQNATMGQEEMDSAGQ